MLPVGQHWQDYYSTNGTATPEGWHTVATPTPDTFPLFYRVFGDGATDRATHFLVDLFLAMQCVKVVGTR